MWQVVSGTANLLNDCDFASGRAARGRKTASCAVSWFNTERPHESIDDLTPSWWKNCTTVTEPASPRPADTKRSLRKRRGGSINALAALRTPHWLGDSATRLHALASLSAHAQQLLPGSVHDAREQEYSWTKIGQLLGLTPNTAARRYRKQP